MTHVFTRFLENEMKWSTTVEYDFNAQGNYFRLLLLSFPSYFSWTIVMPWQTILVKIEICLFVQGYEPFVSYQGLEQLHRFIFVMAITHISYSCLTMLLAIVKVRIFFIFLLLLFHPDLIRYSGETYHLSLNYFSSGQRIQQLWATYY